jgi:glycosyltransferase involved in cell wall biosynthesis
MKILFISHSYPPIKGGVESQNYNLAKKLQEKADVKIIANGKGKSFLPIFIPWSFLKAFFLMTKYDVCLFGNGVLAPIGAVLKFFHPKKKFFCIIHGLDITFANREGFLSKVYKKINIPSMKKFDKLFMVGNATIEEAVSIGIDRDLCKFIPNGVNKEDFKENHTKKELSQIYGKNIEDKKIILRLGRFVPHKGTSWFIKNVMPKLPKDMVMIATGNRVSQRTAGDQDDVIEGEKAIIENDLENQVRLIPSIPQNQLKILLNTVDIVVSPNVKTHGTMEGFGINVIEAGACERIVLASNMEGLADAIKNGENGILVEPGNEEKWIKKINAIIEAGNDFIENFGKKASKHVEENYSWEKISQEYIYEMKK